MENLVDDRSTSSYILKFVRVLRLILFTSVIGFQTYFGFHYGFMYFLFNTVTPFFVIIMDAIMFNKSKDDMKEFYLVAVIICLIALGITVGPMFPILFFPYIATFGSALIYLLYFAVMIISFIELMTLIYLTRPQERYDEDVWNEERDTIEIQ